MNDLKSQATVHVSRDGQRLHSLPLEQGVTVVGRNPSCQLQLDDRMISRRHCEIRLKGDQVTVTDLNSRNGVYMGASRLPPAEAVTWPASVPLRIGPFELQLVFHVTGEEDSAPVRARRIVCREAAPPEAILMDKPLIVGRDRACDMVLDDRRVSRRQCRVWQQEDEVWVTDLSGRGTTRVGTKIVPDSAPVAWTEAERLHVGPYTLLQSLQAASPEAAAEAAPAPAPISESLIRVPAKPDIRRRMWHEWMQQVPWLFLSFLLGSACLVLALGVGAYRFVRGAGTEPTGMPDPTASMPVAEVSATARPRSTPTPQLTPSVTPITTHVFETVVGPTSTPAPTLPCTPQAAGWLDLPFPYDGDNTGPGNAEQFRQASQRAAAGGRITSFFDHEFPVYKQGEQQFGGTQAWDTLVLFDGSRSLNKWIHPDQAGDYYSGHPGYDFSTFEWRKPTTPVLAPAAGTFYGAGMDNLGNSYVWLLHDMGAAGVYRTSYLHLELDEYFDAMLHMERGTPIAAGTRIGTMGNTGHSTGHHLHFEVRRDCNGDGKFSLSEAVDPYGFIPSTEIPSDPLSTWDCGASEYLWKYTLEPVEEGGQCAPVENRFRLNPAPFHGYVSLHTFIWTTADPSQAKPVRIPLGASKLDLVEFDSIGVHLFEQGTWTAVPWKPDFQDKQFYVVAELSVPGMYTVAGKPKQDVIPPTTRIVLEGQQQEDAYIGAVTVELQGMDEGEGVNQIQYSLDCGQTWQVYDDRPFQVTRQDLAVCRGTEDTSEDEWGLEEDTFLILAAAIDWAGNIEQPPSQQLFRLLAGDSG